MACLRRDCSERVQLSVRGAAGSGGVSAYICLDELTALLPYSAHGAEDIHPLFRVHHVDHAVNDDKRPGPPHPGAAERQRDRRRRLTNTQATPERFVSRKRGDGARRFRSERFRTVQSACKTPACCAGVLRESFRQMTPMGERKAAIQQQTTRGPPAEERPPRAPAATVAADLIVEGHQ